MPETKKNKVPKEKKERKKREKKPKAKREGPSHMSKNDGYCLKCKATRTINNPEHKVIGKNNQPAILGYCSVCSTRMSRILPKN